MLLFPDFLSDDKQYSAAEQFWRELWEQAAPPKHWVTPWLNTSFGDGRPFCDGNPIFSAYSAKAGRAVRVIQNMLEGDCASFTWWVDTTEDARGAFLESLTIACVLTQETSARARRLFERWVRDCMPASELGDVP